MKWVSEVAQLCPTLCDPVDCSPPVSSIHGILQARVLEWGCHSFSRGSSRPRDRTQVSRIQIQTFLQFCKSLFKIFWYIGVVLSVLKEITPGDFSNNVGPMLSWPECPLLSPSGFLLILPYAGSSESWTPWMYLFYSKNTFFGKGHCPVVFQ